MLCGLSAIAELLVLLTVIFCRGYLKINDSAVKQYLLTKFCVFFQSYSESIAHNSVKVRSDWHRTLYSEKEKTGAQ